MVVKLNGDKDETGSVPPPSPHPNPRPQRSRSVQQQSQSLPKQQREGMTPNLELPEDRKIGDGHRSSAISVSAKQLLQSKSGNTSVKATYLDMITGESFFEAFSGTGRMAASVRKCGLDVFEFDLNQQGGRRNILHANVLHELKALIAHPMCRGIWFGYPCGTFSSARRNDGGPKPLRGTNPKDIRGPPHLVGKERGRVDSANKLLLRKNELMKLCERSNVPGYLENPLSSKLWMHPIIKKWVSSKSSHIIEFDYCQFGTEWRVPTRILFYWQLKIPYWHGRALQGIMA